MVVHYPGFYLEYGVSTLTYTAWWEKAHVKLVKVPYLRTGRNVKSLLKLVVIRVALWDTVRQKKSVLRRLRKKHTADRLLKRKGNPRVRKVWGKARAGPHSFHSDCFDAEAKKKTGYVTLNRR